MSLVPESLVPKLQRLSFPSSKASLVPKLQLGNAIAGETHVYLAATRSFTWLLFPALLTLVFTLILGRFFCGWICPLGTVLDLVTGRIKKTAPIRFLKGNLKYWLLLPLYITAEADLLYDLGLPKAAWDALWLRLLT